MNEIAELMYYKEQYMHVMSLLMRDGLQPGQSVEEYLAQR